MKKLLVSLIFCLLPVNLSALQVINGGSLSIDVECRPAKEKHIVSAKQDINLFVNSYRKKTIKNYLHQIRMCRNIKLRDMSWPSGTYDRSKKIIYLKVAGRTDTEYLLHHEFSSLLLKSFINSAKSAQIENKFLKINKNCYVGVSRSHQSNWMREYPPNMRAGFIVPYAQTNFENDFNMIASFLKTSYLKNRVERAKKFKLLNKKITIVEKFYKNL
tara:strand:- start:354 stop:1001 length:648 start_codon:yes stop_codon:yes gene_type:complete